MRIPLPSTAMRLSRPSQRYHHRGCPGSSGHRGSRATAAIPLRPRSISRVSESLDLTRVTAGPLSPGPGSLVEIGASRDAHCLAPSHRSHSHFDGLTRGRTVPEITRRDGRSAEIGGSHGLDVRANSEIPLPISFLPSVFEQMTYPSAQTAVIDLFAPADPTGRKSGKSIGRATAFPPQLRAFAGDATPSPRRVEDQARVDRAKDIQAVGHRFFFQVKFVAHVPMRICLGQLSTSVPSLSSWTTLPSSLSLADLTTDNWRRLTQLRRLW